MKKEIKREIKKRRVLQKRLSNFNFNDEVNKLFERLVHEKERKLTSFEQVKKDLIQKFDAKIDELYEKRDFVREIFLNKKKLKLYRVGFWRKVWKTDIGQIITFSLSMPFIYAMIVPAVIMHFFLEIYHQICFRIYGIPLVRAKDYFVFDRRLLPYLNWFEKFNCFYCSYFNCLVAYLQEIAGRTERYWCPIKHSRRVINTHSHYNKFVDYSDAKKLRLDWEKLRKFEEKKVKKN
jgi:hypothetical protein